MPLHLDDLTLTVAVARCLNPPEGRAELYKVCEMLRKLVQLAPNAYAVVDPHDFIEVLSCCHLGREDKDGLAIVRRLRSELVIRIVNPVQGGWEVYKKELLVPFL